MKVLNNIIVLVLFTIIVSCGTSKTTATPEQIAALEEMVNNKEFRIESDWAYPQTTAALQRVMNSGLMNPGSSSGAVNLIGNPNFLKVSKDSVTSFLPYFGERQMNVSYGGRDSGIEFNGEMSDYKAEKSKNGGYKISFTAQSHSESFNVFIELFPNKNASMNLNGNSRFPIRYSGNLVTEEDKKD
ncbi:DUF4251 domain-containing protein [Gaetbulibacter saemankumensis]|uniref:DUF4251 domain-containing protein n=1 Tax=Gaetbulibacter saemankumensis TaxID=311208 RepID=UPI0004066D36|nr:DUF4251 domain-containing protein [Gaetbulibacter saemankumensis]